MQTYPEPAPRPLGTMASVAFGLFVPLVPILIIFSIMLGNSPDAGFRVRGLVIVLLFFGLPPALPLTVVLLRRRFNRRIARLRPMLWQAWHSAFYCAACAGCFLPASPWRVCPPGS